MAQPCILARTHIRVPISARSCGASAVMALAILSAVQPALCADDNREREYLAAIVRQIDMLDRLAGQSAAAAPSQRSRYHFDYRRLDADIRRIRAGVTDYLNPPRAQPRDPRELFGQYRAGSGTEAGQ